MVDWPESQEVVIGLFNNILLQHFVIGHSPINDFTARLRKNRGLNEPIRFAEIVSFFRTLHIFQFGSNGEPYLTKYKFESKISPKPNRVSVF